MVQKTLLYFLIPVMLYSGIREDSIKKLSFKADSVAKLNKFDEQLNYLDALVDDYQYLGRMAIADSLLRLAIRISDKHDFLSRKGDALNTLAQSYNLNGMMDSSIIYFKKSLKIFENLNNLAMVANLQENIGTTYNDKGSYKEAMEYQLAALKIREENGINGRLHISNLNIGKIYYQLGELEKFEFYLRKALKLSKTIPGVTDNERASILYEFGGYFRQVNNPDSAKFYFKRVIEIGEKIEWFRAVSAGSGSLGNVYRDLNQLDSALFMFKKSYELELKIRNLPGAMSEINNIGQLYFLQKDYKQALDWLLKGEKFGINHSFQSEISATYEFLSQVYYAIGEFQKAHDYYKKFHENEEKLKSADHKKYLTELENKYQNTIKEQKIELLSKENSLKDSQLNFGLLIGFILAVGGVSFYRFKKKKNLLEQNELEQKLLKSQMNPHFIFNALASIQKFIYANKPREAAGFLSSFSTLSRAILTNSHKDYIPLSEEIKMLSDYLTLEKLRFNDGFDFEISCNESEDAEFINMPPMMVQPFIENAIKHGFSEIDYQGRLLIDFYCLEKIIQIRVVDNGVGLKEAEKMIQKDHKSMAMTIFKDRKIILEKKFNVRLNYQVKDLAIEGKQGTEIYLELPIIEEN